MTPALTGGKKPWLIAGVLLITGVSLVCVPENSMVIVLFLPAMISVWAGRSKGILAYAVIAAPALLGVVPVFIGGAVTYAIVMLCGLTMFWMLKKAKPGMSIILPTILVSAITLVILIAESHSKGISLSQNISTMAKSLMDNILSLSSSTLSPGDLTDLNADRAVIEARITKLFPFITIAGTVVPMWINLVIASKIEFKINLTRWSNPEWLIYLFILFSIGVLLPNNQVNTVALNALGIICIAYLFQGFSIIAYYFASAKVVAALRYAIYILIIFSMYIMIPLIILLGLFDNWFNFRKRIKAKGDEE